MTYFMGLVALAWLMLVLGSLGLSSPIMFAISWGWTTFRWDSKSNQSWRETVQESLNVRQGREFTYFRANSAWWLNSGLPSSPWRLRPDTLAQIAVEAIYAFSESVR